MKRTWLLTPGLAALLRVRAMPDGIERSAIFLSAQKGVVVDLHGRTMNDLGWPLKLQAEINKYFATVFNLPHEDWKPLTRKDKQSPRAWYMENVQPWTIETEEGEANATS